MDEHRESIQVEKPVPPWEQPGSFRLDCEPHRGNFLWWLAGAGLVLGILALFPYWGWVPGLIGIPFNLCSRYLAKADLAKMQAGLMDPSGEGVTVLAMSLSDPGLGLSVIGTVVWVGMFLVAWWINGSPLLLR